VKQGVQGWGSLWVVAVFAVVVVADDFEAVVSVVVVAVAVFVDAAAVAAAVVVVAVVVTLANPHPEGQICLVTLQ